MRYNRSLITTPLNRLKARNKYILGLLKTEGYTSKDIMDLKSINERARIRESLKTARLKDFSIAFGMTLLSVIAVALLVFNYF